MKNKKKGVKKKQPKEVAEKKMEPLIPSDLTQDQLDKLVTYVAGEIGIEIIKHMVEGKENVSEFLIAEKMEMSINEVRQVLYRLQEQNLIHSTRKKDKKKGWYIYYWTFNFVEAKSLISKLKENRVNFLKKRLEMEGSNEFYTCRKKCIRMKYYDAIEIRFLCPECNQIMSIVDNKKQISTIQKELTILEQQMENREMAEA
ncbi:MAG: hypothetical protein KKH88_04510 [Nanoarchaeota archaeon]|nr:hypothetical protein [Nanoarchaeota archaeon]